MDYVFSVLLLGIAVAMTVSWLWIIVIAFSNKETAWGVISILINPAALVYAIMNRDQCKKPLIVFVVGLLLFVLYVGLPFYLL